jgi:hypothetical protein
MHIYEWLDRIQARPGMYLAQPSFDSLAAFIHGYEAALMSNHILEENAPAFAGFAEFVRLQLCTSETPTNTGFGSPSWEAAISTMAINDQERFNLFFRLLHKFRSGKANA